MRAIATLSLYAWIPLVILLFTMMKPRRAILTAFIAGWLFLPMLAIPLAGIPDLSKLTASSIGVILGVALFDTNRLFTFRPRWFDLPMLAWCCSPFITSMQNDLGAWDGMSNVVFQVSLWGLPYFLGRIYFNDWEGIRELAIAILIGGLVYMPFCWLEMRISAKLHEAAYGFVQHSHGMTYRWGGYRPMVFMQSGLALAMWMVAASLVGVWLWVTKSVRQIAGIPMAILIPMLLATTVMCKSTGALILLTAGLGALFWVRWTRTPLSVLALVAVTPIYMYARGSGAMTGEWAVEQITNVMGEERAHSLWTRFDAENKISERAAEAPSTAFGWGKWDPATGRAPWRIWEPRVRRDQAGTEYTIYQDMAITDGLWVITLGTYGWVGLAALTATILLPGLIIISRCPMKLWDHPMAASATALAVLLVLQMIDNLLNAMLNPVFILALGGVCAIGPSLRKRVPMAGLVAPPGQPALPVGAGAGYGMNPGYYAPANAGNGVGIPGFPTVAGLRTPTTPMPAAQMPWRR